MIIKSSFPACSADYFGNVSPNYMMREINEGIAARNFADGVGFTHLFPTIGVTWMLGQCVLEFLKPVVSVAEIEVESGAHEVHGRAIVRRAEMRQDGETTMRFAAKLIPVYFAQRKSAPLEVLEPFWRSSPVPAAEPIPFIAMPAEMHTVEEYTVHYRDCDSNKHMTAFRYLDLILESVGYWEGECHLPERVQIDYKRECLPGETLALQCGEADGIRYCRGVKPDGTVSFHASVKLSEEVSVASKAPNA